MSERKDNKHTYRNRKSKKGKEKEQGRDVDLEQPKQNFFNWPRKSSRQQNSSSISSENLVFSDKISSSKSLSQSILQKQESHSNLIHTEPNSSSKTTTLPPEHEKKLLDSDRKGKGRQHIERLTSPGSSHPQEVNDNVHQSLISSKPVPDIVPQRRVLRRFLKSAKCSTTDESVIDSQIKKISGLPLEKSDQCEFTDVKESELVEDSDLSPLKRIRHSDVEGDFGKKQVNSKAEELPISGGEHHDEDALDPELALALRASMEEERARQGAAARTSEEKRGGQASSSHGANTGYWMLPISEGEDHDEYKFELALALRASMEEERARQEAAARAAEEKRGGQASSSHDTSNMVKAVDEKTISENEDNLEDFNNFLMKNFKMSSTQYHNLSAVAKAVIRGSFDRIADFTKSLVEKDVIILQKLGENPGNGMRS